MTINERYSATYKRGEWTLTETYMGKDKDKNPKEQTNTFYFGKLSHLIQSVINRISGDCETLEELKELLESAPERVIERLEIKK